MKFQEEPDMICRIARLYSNPVKQSNPSQTVSHEKKHRKEVARVQSRHLNSRGSVPADTVNLDPADDIIYQLSQGVSEERG